MSPRKEVLADGIDIWLGDCRKILPEIGKVDAIITDPPYGIGIAANPVRQAHAKSDWDNAVPVKETFDLMRSMSAEQIIWGGNYFALPAHQRFLIWDKGQPEDFSLAMCEMAWVSNGGPAKMWRQSVLGYAKEHPTQKPVQLMEWCLKYVPKAQTICDPFMGSGTTGVACVNFGRSFIGIEREPKYFDIARRRISEALDRPRFALDEPVRLQQAVLF